ncbi:MAG: phosphoribosyltransferase family protein [Pseudomonadota bacterium]
MQTLFSTHDIDARIDALARDIAHDLPSDFLLAPILTGAFVFAADLSRALHRHGADPLVDFLQLSSYGGARASSGVVTLTKDFSVEVKGKTVLLLDDVLDTGRSLHFGKRMVEERGAAAVKIGVLVKKLTGRAEDLYPDYIGFEAGAEDFLIGYGMDDNGRQRGVPFIARD